MWIESQSSLPPSSAVSRRQRPRQRGQHPGQPANSAARKIPTRPSNSSRNRLLVALLPNFATSRKAALSFAEEEALAVASVNRRNRPSSFIVSTLYTIPPNAVSQVATVKTAVSTAVMTSELTLIGDYRQARRRTHAESSRGNNNIASGPLSAQHTTGCMKWVG
jgi:hypothetical protein